MGKASSEKKQRKVAKLPHQQKDRFGLYVTIAVVLVGVLIAGFVIWGNTQVAKVTNAESSEITPQGVVADGIVVNKDGLVPSEPYDIETTLSASEYDSELNNISMYIDYACPHCAEFEEANIDQIDSWLENGTIDTLTIHPMAFLSNYSLEAANAVSCVANYAPEYVWDAHKMLMQAQNEAWNSKTIAAQMSELTSLESQEFTRCMRGGEFADFIAAASERAQTGPLPATSLGESGSIAGTPTIFVNGNKYENNPADAAIFASFVAAVIAGEDVTAVAPQENQIESTTEIGN